MKICLIAEGSYPYILGGVSSWIQQLVTSMPQHEFIIYSIGAKVEQKSRYAYQLPENISKVEEVFLDEFKSGESTFSKDFGLTEEEKAAIKSLLDETDTDWSLIFSLFSSGRIDQVTGFIMSRDIYDIIHEICLERYAHLPFTEMFWTMRSMLLPLFVVLKHPPPEADVYHSVSTGYGGVAGSIAAFLRDKPYILTEHGIYTREREEEIIKASWIKGYLKDLWIQYFYSMSTAAYSSADPVISLFEKNRQIQIALGCKEEKTQIISNGVRLPDAAPKHHVDKADFTIGAIVRLVPIKDIKTMIQSFAIVKQKHPGAKFLIMGPVEEDEEYYQECLQLAAALELADIEFTGAVNIQDYLSEVDVLVLSSISEGQPLAILEGLAMGIPYVATDVGSCKEIVYGTGEDKEKAGFVVPVMHYVELANRISQLCESAQLRNQMGRTGRTRVQMKYTERKFIKSYQQLYENVVEQYGRSRI